MMMLTSSRVRRVRVLATIALAALMLWIWTKNIGGMDRDAYRNGLIQQSIGGGSVMRPIAQVAQQVPPLRPPPPPQRLHETKPDAFLPPGRTSKPAGDSHSPVHADRPSLDEPVAGNPSAGKLSADIPKPLQASKDAPPTIPNISPNMHANPRPAAPAQFEAGRKEVVVDPSATTSTVHWSKSTERYPITSTIQLPTGTSIPLPQIQRESTKLKMHGADKERLMAVRAAAMRSWSGYRQFAMGHDEVKPVSGGFRDPFNGWGSTLVDGLDTLWVMGMREEFEEAVEAVGKIDFTTSLREDIPLFETVIRYLGGLVAAYDVSGKKYITLLDKAVQLAEVLYSAFDTPNRVPLTYYRWKPSAAAVPHRASSRIILAEIGTLSMEFTRLAQLTGEPKYYDAIDRVTDMLEEFQNNTRLPGMWPTILDGTGCGKPPPPPRDTTKGRPASYRPVIAEKADLRAAAGGIARGAEDTIVESPAVMAAELGRLTASGKQGEEDVGGFNKALANAKSIGDNLKWKREVESPRLTDDLSTDYGNAENFEYADPKPELELRTPPSVEVVTVQTSREIDGCIPQGLISTSKGTSETYTLGGASDSMYEYLTKEYLLLGGLEEKYKTMYLASIEVIIEELLYKPMTPQELDILMLGTLTSRPDYNEPIETRGYKMILTAELSHLVCFAGGMFAMGGVLFDKPEHVEIGSKLTEGCVWAYNATDTGVMPENAFMLQCDSIDGDCRWNETAWYHALDPHPELRLASALRQETAVKPPSIPSKVDSPGVKFASSSDLKKDDGLSGVRPEDRHLLEPLQQKRQLEALSSDAQSSSSTQQASTPAAAAKLVKPSTNPVHSSYHRVEPLSHEDYVRKKIKDERIPAGFTHVTSRAYLLRPEAIESVFYMYRITGDLHWREVGWNMFAAIDEYTRSNYGYSALDDVTNREGDKTDHMESFWMAETLKYFYLLFDEPETWSLDEWVLNTEAHLFRRPKFEFAKTRF